MTPVITIIGSPNTGKSTLFNRLTASRKALVADYAGVTRDRIYGIAEINKRNFIIIDTGGFSEQADPVIDQIHLQIEHAIVEADLCILLVDSSNPPSSDDLMLLNMIRKKGQKYIVLLNKADVGRDKYYSDFYTYYPEFTTISAIHNRGIDKLKTNIEELFPEEQPQEEPEKNKDEIKIAIIGRPNVGKSTLVNSIIGEQRVMALDMPGTTRDVIDINIKYKEQNFCILDTPGVRKRAKVFHFLEKFSVLKSLQAAESCDVAIVLIDSTEGLVEQDLRLIEIIKNSAPAVVFAINKSDHKDKEAKQRTEKEVDRRHQVFVGTQPMYISALKSKGIDKLLETTIERFKNSNYSWPTSKLNSILQASQIAQPPAMKGNIRPKLKFVHQKGANPPTFVIHGNQTKKINSNYKTYLYRLYREQLNIEGVCFKIVFQDSHNPYIENKSH